MRMMHATADASRLHRNDPQLVLLGLPQAVRKPSSNISTGKQHAKQVKRACDMLQPAALLQRPPKKVCKPCGNSTPAPTARIH
jgi:hypothetical protein